jgi:hypothetical protein
MEKLRISGGREQERNKRREREREREREGGTMPAGKSKGIRLPLRRWIGVFALVERSAPNFGY